MCTKRGFINLLASMDDDGDDFDDGNDDGDDDAPESLAGVRVVAHAAPELPFPYLAPVPNQLQNLLLGGQELGVQTKSCGAHLLHTHNDSSQCAESCIAPQDYSLTGRRQCQALTQTELCSCPA